MKWVLYTIAALATVLAALLWMFVLSQLRSAPAAGAVAVPSVSVSGAPVPGELPVVPVFRAAYGPGDTVYDAQLVAYREGRVFCVGGVFARRVVRGGVVSYAPIQTDRGPIPCL